jgi:beta-lactamase class A
LDATTRRAFLLGSAALVTGCAHQRKADAIAAIEDQLGGRIGFSALDTASGRRIKWRADERFAMCSTFKVALAAAVLARIDQGSLQPEHMLRFDPAKLLGASRATEKHPDGRISVIEACEGAVSVSDNTAANALLELIGGPPVVTGYFRSLGDKVSRLDRIEMELNSNMEGDVRDTTSPNAMLHNLGAIVLGDTLQQASSNLLTEWMLHEQNGTGRTRAGLPTDWRVANKPGTSANGAVNDIAVAWPPDRKPMVMAIYTNAPNAKTAASEGAIAELAALAKREFESR